MRKLIFTIFIFCALAVNAQNNIPSAQVGQTYGEVITADNAIDLGKLSKVLAASDTPFKGKIEGKVVEVCKKKGCFIKVKQADAEPIMVKFKDYGFFMPQDIVGKTIVMDGEASVKVTSVERLKHYAEDAGKSAEEINKITEPKRAINILASGVVVK
ncbi:DUF4920 domain-containing protein [Pseudopedobacter beijingensis]|uniref:DUF4920 domain-containing protein n=1 Tax=Pseudopedobacter beijingensis TaxID=1207056 RepID=A0ABW4IDF3_9SPHI